MPDPDGVLDIHLESDAGAGSLVELADVCNFFQDMPAEVVLHQDQDEINLVPDAEPEERLGGAESFSPRLVQYGCTRGAFLPGRGQYLIGMLVFDHDND